MTADSTFTLTLMSMRVPVVVTVDGYAAADAVREAREAWGTLVVEGEAPAGARELSFTVDLPSDIEQFLDSLSTRVTLEGIDEHSGDLLMLHAAGFAHRDTGTVLACVAPSGTGKTTLSRATAGHFSYVTDETVAVTSRGEVVRYPKPLSVKQHTSGWAPKQQVQPESLGLTVAPDEGLTLRGIVLLRREASTTGASASASPPTLEPVPLGEALLALVPELSYLGRMHQPLHRIAEAVLRTGGVTRLTYQEATDAIDLLSGHPALGAAAPPWDADLLAPLAESEREVDLWRSHIASMRLSAVDKNSGGGRALVTVTPPSDVFVDLDTGEAVILAQNTVTLVSAIAAAALLAAAEPFGESTLRALLIDLFGEPPAIAVADPLADLVATLVAGGYLSVVEN